jgi:competence protein ComEC
VWAILFLTPKLVRALPTVPRWLTGSVGGTLAAQLASFPLLAWHYGQAPLGGLGANLLAVPLAGVVLAGGMATCLLGPAAPLLAAATGWVTGWAARWMVWVSAATAALPGACWEVAMPGRAAIIGWYAGMVFFGWLLNKRARAEEADEP